MTVTNCKNNMEMDMQWKMSDKTENVWLKRSGLQNLNQTLIPHQSARNSL